MFEIFLFFMKKIILVLLVFLSFSCKTTINRENVLVFAKAKDAVTLDPADITESESSSISQNIYETLVRYKDESTEIEPCLAKSWSISKNNLEWTFKLRENVKFHDGTDFDAEAVKFNYDRQMNEKNPYRFNGKFEYWNLFFNNVKKIEVVDKYTIKFYLSSKDPTFLTNLALFTMGIASPTAIKKYGRDFFKNPVGTGPFKFSIWLQNEKILLKSFESYWGGKPKLEKLIFKPIADNSVRLLELESNSIDGMDGINPDDLERIEKNKNLYVLKQPGMNVGYLAFNTEKYPFNNRNFRLAINYAVNKEALVKAFFANGKVGEVAKNPIPPTIWSYNDNIKPYEYNVEKAKELIKGIDLPKTIKFWTMPVSRPYMPNPQKIAESIQEDLNKINVKTEIITYDWGTYLDKVSKGEHDMCLLGWIGDNGDPDNFLYTLLSSKNTKKGSASNYSFYKNSEMDKYLEFAKFELNQNRRIEAYKKAQEIFHKDVPWLVLFHSKQLVAFNKKVKGYKLHPTGAKIFRNVYIEK
jgi:peptide/nickel transport system substrate-binding protein